jgi:glycosyltransferase involved in cell wall biosynthesis
MLVVNSVEMGGVEEHVRQIATGLVARRASVTAVVPEESAIDPLADAVSAVGVAVERLTLAGGMFSGAGLGRLMRMVRLLRARRPHILHLHLVGWGGGRWVQLAALLAGVPRVVCTIHVAPRERQGVKARANRALASLAVARYIAVSQASRGQLVSNLGLAASSVAVIPNAVELQRFDAPAGPARATIRARWGIPPDAPVVGSLARLSEQKGLRYLIAAMPAVLAEHPGAYAMVVGEGSLRDDLEAQARELGVDERVLLVGYHANTVEHLRAMDLFVLPSLYEGMPLAILEAMGAGLPVVATAVDGTPEAVLDGETGLLVPSADSAALTAAINGLLSDRERASRMGKAGRARAESLSETALLDRLERVYRDVLARRRR